MVKPVQSSPGQRFVSIQSACGKHYEVYDAKQCKVIATAVDHEWACAIANNMSAVERMKGILAGTKKARSAE